MKYPGFTPDIDVSSFLAHKNSKELFIMTSVRTVDALNIARGRGFGVPFFKVGPMFPMREREGAALHGPSITRSLAIAAEETKGVFGVEFSSGMISHLIRDHHVEHEEIEQHLHEYVKGPMLLHLDNMHSGIFFERVSSVSLDMRKFGGFQEYWEATRRLMDKAYTVEVNMFVPPSQEFLNFDERYLSQSPHYLFQYLDDRLELFNVSPYILEHMPPHSNSMSIREISLALEEIRNGKYDMLFSLNYGDGLTPRMLGLLLDQANISKFTYRGTDIYLKMLEDTPYHAMLLNMGYRELGSVKRNEAAINVLSHTEEWVNMSQEDQIGLEIRLAEEIVTIFRALKNEGTLKYFEAK